MKTILFLTAVLVLSFLNSCDLYEDIFDNKEDKPCSVTDVDGNVYKTVTIGNQVWMAENLKTTKYCDSSSIYYTMCSNIWGNLTKGACCWYSRGDEYNKNTYGVLYNWYAVKTGKLCPVGWHIPTRDEWAKLEHHLGGSSVAGGKLKSVTGWNSSSMEATNRSGFSALPGGMRRTDGGFGYIGSQAYWWSSTEDSSNNAWGCCLVSSSSYLTTTSFQKTTGFSIRCIRD